MGHQTKTGDRNSGNPKAFRAPDTSGGTIRISGRFRPEQVEALTQLIGEFGGDKSYHLRQSLDLYLQSYQDQQVEPIPPASASKKATSKRKTSEKSTAPAAVKDEEVAPTASTRTSKKAPSTRKTANKSSSPVPVTDKVDPTPASTSKKATSKEKTAEKMSASAAVKDEEVAPTLSKRTSKKTPSTRKSAQKSSSPAPVVDKVAPTASTRTSKKSPSTRKVAEQVSSPVPMEDKGGTEQFRRVLQTQLNQFETFLNKTLKPETIAKYKKVSRSLIDFLCIECKVADYQEIRRGMVCSQFRRWCSSNIADVTVSQVNAAVKKFFAFLVLEQHIAIGEDVLKGLSIKSGS